MCGSRYVFHKAIRKYGFEQFDFCVLYESDDAKYVLSVVEPHFIKVLKPEYNTTLGGEGVLKDHLTEEHKKNLSINHADVTGERNPFFGKTHTIETKQKIAKSKLGKVGPNKGRRFSEEARRNMSIAAKNRSQNRHLNSERVQCR